MLDHHIAPLQFLNIHPALMMQRPRKLTQLIAIRSGQLISLFNIALTAPPVPM